MAHGATAVVEQYDGKGRILGMEFKVRLNGTELAFRIPLQPEGVHALLKADAARGRIKRYYATPEQAERIAWRVLRDWVDVQMAVVEAGAVKMTQVFTGYLLIDGQHTVHEILEGTQFLLPEGTGK